MSLWRQLSRGLRALTQRRVVDAELDDEIRDYYERARAELDLDGLTEREAARVTRLRLGDAEKARDELRAYGWENFVEGTLADLRLAQRRLFASPAFALAGILTLALGIGATTAILSAVIPILVAPLPYPAAARIVTITDFDRAGVPMAVTFGTFDEIAARSHSFEAVAAADAWEPALAGTDAGEPERLRGELVTSDYLAVLGVPPALGREFQADDDEPGAARVAVVGDELARRRFGSAAGVLGRMISLDGNAYTVIGVMPPGFENVLAPDAEVWAPRRFRRGAPFDSGEWGHHMRMIGRLAAGISAEQAERELRALAAAPVDEFPRPDWARFEAGLGIDSLQATVTSGARPALLAILGAVALLLVIACANVANLLLARGVGRRAELAVRTALGAGRLRLVRQQLAESAMLALYGGIVGLGIAAVGLRAITALAPAGLPRLAAIRLDLPAFLLALAITAAVGILVGLVPALRGASGDVRVELHSGARTLKGGQARIRKSLVVTEVALALVLLAGAGLIYRSVDGLLATPTGFEASGLLSMEIVATGRRFGSDAEAYAYWQRVLDAVRAVPGVTDAALTSQLPLGGRYDSYGPRFESAPLAAVDETGALRYTVTPGWFRTLGIALRRGRLLDSGDLPGAPEAVLISESMAERWFGGADPIGQRVRFGPEQSMADRPWGTIVGVVADVKQASLALTPPGAFYVSMGQWPWIDVVQSLALRTDGEPLALLPAVRRAVWSVDPTAPIARVATLDELVKASEAERHFVLIVLAVFGFAALLLAALGLYGVIAGSVAERRREIGLRVALGASRLGIVGLVVRQGLLLTAVGSVLGIGLAYTATRAFVSLLYGVSVLDPVTYALVVALLVAVALLASTTPALRAARVDPTVALRGE
jgi:predicted permease